MKPKFMEYRDLGFWNVVNPQCFPQNMRKGFQSLIISCKVAPNAFFGAFLVGEWVGRQAKKVTASACG
jgi:hypothetical protein